MNPREKRTWNPRNIKTNPNYNMRSKVPERMFSERK